MTIRRTEKVTLAVSGLVVVGLIALASPLINGAMSWASAAAVPTGVAEPTSEPTAAATPESTPGIPDGYVYMGDDTWIPEGGPGDCDASALVSMTGEGSVIDTARLLRPENLEDTGARQFAEGVVGRDAEGRIATYTVAPGDALWAIGDRLCIYNGLALGSLNGHAGYEAIQPGAVLVIDPAAVPDFVFVYRG